MCILTCIRQLNNNLLNDDCIDVNDDCELVIDLHNEHVILEADRYQEHGHKMCDYIVYFYCNRIIVLILELKSNNPDILEVFEKLENGYERAYNILTDCMNEDTKYALIPALICKSVAPSARKKLLRKRIKCGSNNSSPTVHPCGINCRELFKERGIRDCN